MGFGDGFNGVPTQERQVGHVAQGHDPAQAINKTAQRFRVVRVRRAKGGASSKMCRQVLPWQRGTATCK
jgi:hypothetical protein